jgi:zinc protease
MNAPRGSRLRVIPAILALVGMVLAGGCARGVLGGGSPGEPGARGGPPVGAHVIEQLRFPPLEFEPPEPDRFELANGVTVFHLHDAALPIVEVFMDLKGGYIYFGREQYGAASALVPLMRNGGTLALPPDSVDALLEYHALSLHSSHDGGRMLVGVRALRRQLDLALDLWSSVLLRPRFDPAAVERWRVREVEAVRRAGDFPGSLAVLEFNRLFYGDHPTGWILTEEDLTTGRVNADRLRQLHGRTVCPESAIIGVAGDITGDEARHALEVALAGWLPCGDTLRPPPPPALRQEAGVFVIPKTLAQSTIVVGQPGGIRMSEADEFFASRVANWVLGGGGATSRMHTRIRTEAGLAYSASSIWGAAREHERILGAITHTRAESTVEATRQMIGILEGSRTEPPTAEEVHLAREAIANGFVFGFGSAAQIVSRQVAYLADGLPPDWMSRYLAGIRRVDTEAVADVLNRYVRPGGFTILIVGDTTAFDPAALGAFQVLPGH